jgi:hypothetical protein
MKTTILSYKNLLFLVIFAISSNCIAGNFIIKNNLNSKTILFGNDKIRMVLDYNLKCAISKIDVNNQKVISTSSGVYTQIRTLKNEYSTLILAKSPLVKFQKNILEVSNIKYGDESIIIDEKWKFVIEKNDIKFDVERKLSKPLLVEESSFPTFVFDNMNTWEGAFLGNGGLAWFYLFNEKLCTYGVHTNYSSFWNSKTDNGLKISVLSEVEKVAMKYSRSNNDELVYNVTASKDELIPRYDGDTHRRRFIREKTDVWASFALPAGLQHLSLILTPFNYTTEYYKGNFNGLDGNKITSVLNTIARIGVIDSKLYGGNSWHTPYGPICLHEQYIAQFAVAINDINYINGYKQCLDYYKDNAIKPDGRVLPRWAYDNSDAMPGTATPLGFYEAQWGYLLDSNPDYVSNVSQLYNICGDINWVRDQKTTCEKALDYLLKRDSNKNNLVEMITESHLDNKGSDWIDIIWASFENAFVNVKLYYALTLWSDVEKQLGDIEKTNYYSDYAVKLKESFNKSTTNGGFWDEKNKWYVYWLDKDKSVHGNNFVVPVNLMAVAYGICEDENQRKAILDKLEDQMQKENLFIWPLCLYSYEKGEGRDNQFPFPHYENGDIFLSWGAVGVQAYASYKPEVALKYIENILSRHSQDGLAFQRYGRTKQNGLGDDILSGNCLAVIGLYQSIYGINPLYNRLYLNPHLTEKLNNTKLRYNYRGENLDIFLGKENYSIANKLFKLTSNISFGFYSEQNKLFFYNSKDETASMEILTGKNKNLSVEIINWKNDERSWKQSSTSWNAKFDYKLCNLKPNGLYSIIVDGGKIKGVKSFANGTASFTIQSNGKPMIVEVKNID